MGCDCQRELLDEESKEFKIRIVEDRCSPIISKQSFLGDDAFTRIRSPA